MFDWLRKLTGGTPARAAARAAAVVTPEEQAAGEVAQAAYERELAGEPPPLPPLPDASGAPPEAWAAALGLPVEALAAGAVKLTPEEEFVSAALLDHFETHRPGPASFPAISLQILDLAKDPTVDAARLGQVIQMDAALSAGVLVLANSPVFRGASVIETPRDAIVRLGVSEVSRLATALSTRSLFKPEVRAEFATFGPAWNRIFYHSAVVARTAANLATVRKLPGAEQAFVGGMLHDVGKSIGLRSLSALAIDGQVRVLPPDSIERILHHVHVEIGAEVHGAWRLPEHLTTLAQRHHEPGLPAESALAGVHLVRLVSALSLLRSGAALFPGAPAEVVESARALGLGPRRVQALAVELEENGEWVRLLFGEEQGGPSRAG